MTQAQHTVYLEQASGAVARGDFLGAIQLALRAAEVPRGQEQVRCDAYMLLALTNLEIGLGEHALAFAVGAHLAARWLRDDAREERASAMVSMVITRHPNLSADNTFSSFH